MDREKYGDLTYLTFYNSTRIQLASAIALFIV